MIFKATLTNKAHPEYGQATIPFPIPGDQYDHTIELLDGLGIGSPTGQDCQVDFLDSKYRILNRLVVCRLHRRGVRIRASPPEEH